MLEGLIKLNIHKQPICIRYINITILIKIKRIGNLPIIKHTNITICTGDQNELSSQF